MESSLVIFNACPSCARRALGLSHVGRLRTPVGSRRRRLGEARSSGRLQRRAVGRPGLPPARPWLPGPRPPWPRSQEEREGRSAPGTEPRAAVSRELDPPKTERQKDGELNREQVCCSVSLPAPPEKPCSAQNPAPPLCRLALGHVPSRENSQRKTGFLRLVGDGLGGVRGQELAPGTHSDGGQFTSCLN